MTVIAAIAQEGAITMCADTCTNYVETYVYGARKIRRFDSGDTATLIGFSGDGATAPLTQQHLTIEGCDGTDDWANAVAVSITQIAVENRPPGSDAHGLDGACLLAAKGRLWYLFTNQAVPAPDGIAAIGSGTDVALGVMRTATALGEPPLLAVQRAVTEACRTSPGCGVDDSGPLIETITD